MGVELGNFIKTLRLNKNYSVKDAAKLSNMSKSYWDFIEKGLREPSLEKLKSIAETLNCTVDELIYINSKNIIKELDNEYEITTKKTVDSKKFILETQHYLYNNLIKFLQDEGWDIDNDTFHYNKKHTWDILAKKNGVIWAIDIKIFINNINNLNSFYNFLGKLICNSNNNISRYSIATNNKSFFNLLINNYPEKLNKIINLSFILIENNNSPKFFFNTTT